MTFSNPQMVGSCCTVASEGMVAGTPARLEGWRTHVLRYPSTTCGIPGVLMMRGLGAPGDSGRTASVFVGATPSDAVTLPRGVFGNLQVARRKDLDDRG